jgi:hypothetical protein
MKYQTTLSLSVLCLLLAACKKDDGPALALTGKWQLRQTIESEAMGGKWQNVQKESEIESLEFRADGTYQSNLKPNFTRYSVKPDSSKITITSPAGKKYVYLYKLDSKYLTFSEIEPIICIEGCSSRFVKITE